MSKKAAIDTALIVFTAATLYVVTAKGEEVGKAQQEILQKTGVINGRHSQTN